MSLKIKTLKFAKVFLAHMDGLLILPVPFNFLLEWINDLRYLIRNLRDKRKKWQCTLWHGCFMVHDFLILV